MVMTTVSADNMSEVPGIIDAAVAAGANVFAFSRYVPSGGELSAAMSPQDYRELLAICDKKFKEYEAAGCQTYFNKKDHLWTLYEYETGEFRIPETAKDGMIYGGCKCGNCHITILPTGDIYACRRVAESKVGNALEDRLADVWVAANANYCRTAEAVRRWQREQTAAFTPPTRNAGKSLISVYPRASFRARRRRLITKRARRC